jgi:protein phosphatase-4 regulatory subunit 3
MITIDWSGYLPFCAIIVSNLTFHEVQLFNHLVEIIIYLSRTHQFRSKYYIFTEDLASRVAQLLSAPQKHLKLSKASTS